MTIRLKGTDAGHEGLAEHSVFASYEQLLFSASLAEKEGKTVHLSSFLLRRFDAIADDSQLDSAEVIAGLSSMFDRGQARRMGEAWAVAPRNRPKRVTFRVIHPDSRTRV